LEIASDTGILIVVDTQLGFLNQYTEHIPDRIANLIKRDSYEQVLFTRFLNQPDGPHIQLLGWDGCMSAPETDIAPQLVRYVNAENTFDKSGTTGMPDELATLLTDKRVEQVSVVGIDTDMCVLKTAMDIFDLTIEPLIVTDCCASTAGLQAHLAGLAILARNIGSNRLLFSGIGGNQLGAPSSDSDE